MPLDPFYPLERLAFMLEDTDAPVLITQQYLRKRLPTFSGELYLDEERKEIARRSAGNPQSHTTPTTSLCDLHLGFDGASPRA